MNDIIDSNCFTVKAIVIEVVASSMPRTINCTDFEASSRLH